MPDSIADFLHSARPTADRPLLGHTVLLVEDSRFASEAMRLLCLRSGARIRRADSLRAAGRHLRAYHPSIVIVDLGLPDGSGLDLIAELAVAPSRTLVILATSGDSSLAETATGAGADGFLAKPITSLGLFQEAVLSRLPAEARPLGLRAVPDEHVHPDHLALRDDLEHILDLLGDAQDAGTLRYAARFLAGLARTAQDAELAAAADALGGKTEDGEGDRDRIGRLTGLVADRLGRRAVV